MANRVEITENVESAIGLNLTGATVTVRFRGGAQAPVYDRQNGGSLLTQPLVTVNGKIGGDSPAGAWVTEGPYDLDVTFGSDTLTYAWNAAQIPQFVTTLPAGAGTSAPEDGEHAIELYDAANGGAWLRRYRAAVSSWDMVGGPPPAGNSLPAGPRVRQEFYLTGGSPTIQHLRYNGASWDYVGTPPMTPVTGSPLTVLDVGQAGQVRMGHQLALTDFTTLAALPTTPVLVANLGSTSNLGTGGTFTNKGTVTFGVGIEGVSNAAAQFTRSTAQGLYIVDTGASDPFRIKTGTIGGWHKSGSRGFSQVIISKYKTTQQSFYVGVNTSNLAQATLSTDGSTDFTLFGTSDVNDNRWHHIVLINDGTLMYLMVDGVVENVQASSGLFFGGTAPLNVGSFGADASTVGTNPHGGLVDEVFVTADVMTPDQVRMLYSAKIPHGYATTPRLAAMGIRQRRRGAALVAADFPAQPVRLHSFVGGALTDAGSGGVAMALVGTPSIAAGPDGSTLDAYAVSGANHLSATDAGLPSGTSTRSYGLWFKTNVGSSQGIMGWGTLTTADARLIIQSNTVAALSGADTMTGPFMNDGTYHFAVVVEDNSAVDGMKRKLYIDGKLVAVSATLNSITLAGAAKFRVGANPDGTFNFAGLVSRPFVTTTGLTPEQVAVLYQKSGQALSQDPANPGQYIMGFDATNVYAILDSLGTNYQVDMAVAS